MELPTSSRAAVIARLSAAVQLDPALPVPRDWSQLTVTQRLIVDQLDPELGQVLRGPGSMSANVELAIMNGKWADVAPVVKTEAQLREEAVNAWVAANPVPTPEEQAAKLRDRQLAGEASRQESAMIANAKLGAVSRAARGW